MLNTTSDGNTTRVARSRRRLELHTSMALPIAVPTYTKPSTRASKAAVAHVATIQPAGASDGGATVHTTSAVTRSANVAVSSDEQLQTAKGPASTRNDIPATSPGARMPGRRRSIRNVSHT